MNTLRAAVLFLLVRAAAPAGAVNVTPADRAPLPYGFTTDGQGHRPSTRS